MDYQDKSNMFEKVMHLKEIWEQKDILIVEGEKVDWEWGMTCLQILYLFKELYVQLCMLTNILMK